MSTAGKKSATEIKNGNIGPTFNFTFPKFSTIKKNP
jgi:hypothetical protein